MIFVDKDHFYTLTNTRTARGHGRFVYLYAKLIKKLSTFHFEIYSGKCTEGNRHFLHCQVVSFLVLCFEHVHVTFPECFFSLMSGETLTTFGLKCWTLTVTMNETTFLLIEYSIYNISR